MRLTVPSVLVLLSILPGCQTTPTTGTDSIPCAALDSISYSASQDSALTIQEIREFNAVLAELCG